jgi:hypothetical protein
MLEKSQFARPYMIKEELKAMMSSRLNKHIRILHADKGICTVVLDEFTAGLPPYAKNNKIYLMKLVA